MKTCRMQSQHFLKQLGALKAEVRKRKACGICFGITTLTLKRIQRESEFGANLRFPLWDSRTSWSVW